MSGDGSGEEATGGGVTGGNAEHGGAAYVRVKRTSFGSAGGVGAATSDHVTAAPPPAVGGGTTSEVRWNLQVMPREYQIVPVDAFGNSKQSK